MRALKTAAVVALAAVAAAVLTGCSENVEATDPSLRPFVTVAPSGAEVVCEWELQDGSRYTGEWDCEVIHG